MIIACCSKCGYTDLVVDNNDLKNCYRCGVQLKSTGINSREWNLYSFDEQKKIINSCIEKNEVNEEIKTVKDKAKENDSDKKFVHSASQLIISPHGNSAFDEQIVHKEFSNDDEPTNWESSNDDNSQIAARKRKSVIEASNIERMIEDKHKGGKDYCGRITPISVISFVLSITGVLGLIGLILGIVDLTKSGDGRKKILSVLSIVFNGIYMLAAIGFGIFWIISLTMVKPLELKKTNTTIELGSSISTNLDEYVNITDDKMRNDLIIDASRVNTNKVGNYELLIIYGGNEYIVGVDVKDTQGPRISQKEFIIDHHKEYFVEDLVDVYDPSGYTVSFDDGEFSCYYAKEGTYTLKIVAVDSLGNKTIKDIEVDVFKSELDKNKEFFQDISELQKAIVNGY